MAYLRSTGHLSDDTWPRAILMCYQRSLYKRIVAAEGCSDGGPRRHRGLITLPRTGDRVGIVQDIGFGAPSAAGALEEFIALGTTHVVTLGMAGTLQAGVPTGSLVLCHRAVRDEGVSHHYLPASRYVEASASLTEALREELETRAVTHTLGASWTTDALFRETAAELRRDRDEGVSCVEMEAAALFAIGQYRSVGVTSLLLISDSLADDRWQPQWHGEDVATALLGAYQAAISALERSC